MTTQEYNLNVCFNISVRVNNDAIGYVQEQETKKKVAKWVTEEIGLPSGCELDISMGYGEYEVFDIDPVNVEVL